MTEDGHDLDRRQFLCRASVTAWLVATHGPGFSSVAPAELVASVGHGAVARLQSLRLETAAPLSEMKAYYRDLLGLEVVHEGSSELTIEAGESRITFVTAGSGGSSAPFYHFAFNIPQNKLLAAREWQRARTSLIAPPANLRDPRYPEDVVHFAHWNAHSVFFWDPAGNLLEYIARHDLQNSSGGSFSSRDILYASEIGLVADDVPRLAGELKEAFQLTGYRGGSDQFTAVGDELGLLLVMERGRALGFAEGKPAGVSATSVTIRSGRQAHYRAQAYPFEISSA